MCETSVSDNQWYAFLDAHKPLPDKDGRGKTIAVNTREELTQLYTADPRCAPWTGTAFGVVQTVNTWSHHVQGTRGQDKPERNMERAVTGAIDVLDSTTLATLQSVLV